MRAVIVPDDKVPAYRYMYIEPQIPEGVTWVNVSKEAPYGTIVVNWKLENKVFSMKVRIPACCSADVTLPKGVTSCKLNVTDIKIGLPVRIKSGEYIFFCDL